MCCLHQRLTFSQRKALCAKRLLFFQCSDIYFYCCLEDRMLVTWNLFEINWQIKIWTLLWLRCSETQSFKWEYHSAWDLIQLTSLSLCQEYSIEHVIVNYVFLGRGRGGRERLQGHWCWLIDWLQVISSRHRKKMICIFCCYFILYNTIFITVIRHLAKMSHM